LVIRKVAGEVGVLEAHILPQDHNFEPASYRGSAQAGGGGSNSISVRYDGESLREIPPSDIGTPPKRSSSKWFIGSAASVEMIDLFGGAPVLLYASPYAGKSKWRRIVTISQPKASYICSGSFGSLSFRIRPSSDRNFPPLSLR
jgi:hypothetical protein